MPGRGLKIGDKIRLNDGETATVVADRPQRIDAGRQVCFLRDGIPKEQEDTQYESLPYESVQKV